jgi:hypothetical protein
MHSPFYVLMLFSSFTQAKVFDQQQFDQYLHEWIVAADQPFDTTENLEFCCLLECTHLHLGLHIPSASTVKRQIIKMGEDTIQGIKDMIAVCHFSPSIQKFYWLDIAKSGAQLQSQLVIRCLDIK